MKTPMYRPPRVRPVSVRLNIHEDEALRIWCNSLGLDRSELIRQILHRSFADWPPRQLFSADLRSALGLPGMEGA